MIVPSASASPPANDERKNAEPILVPLYRDEVDASGATTTWDALAFGCVRAGYSDKTVWYAYHSTVPLPVRVSTEGSDYDTVLDAFVEDEDGTLTRIACNDDAAGAEHSTFVLDTQPGTVYWIQAGAATGAWDIPPAEAHLVLTVLPGLA